MKNFGDDLKRILNGLAYQDAGEFLAMGEKMKMLGVGDKPKMKASSRVIDKTTTPKNNRIALISDGRDIGAPLDYAIESCTRQNYKIDLLIYGATSTSKNAVLVNRVRSSNLDFNLIQLGENPTEQVVEYIMNHPSLIFVIATPDDQVARVLMEEIIPNKVKHVSVPLVLIENQFSFDTEKQSAA